MRSMTSWCHSWVPWHMLSLATFMPLMASVCSISSLQDRGPIVQMILVLRVLRKPAHWQIRSVMINHALGHQNPDLGLKDSVE